jgi:glycosyltransferase involved in cell wall biosynthesis
MKKIDLLISISENTKKDAHFILNIKTRIEAIPLAADRKIFYRASKESVKKIKKKYNISRRYILSVCTLEPRKNLESLLRAFEKIKDRGKYQLVLVGMTGWIGSDFFENLSDRDIMNDIVFTGYVPNRDLAPLYTGSDLFVFPSLYEGFGLPVLEAMQCGCPVITSNCSSLPEVIGDAGIMIDPTDIAALTRSVEKVLSNPAVRNDMKMKGLDRSKLFSWEKAARSMLDDLKTL